MTKIILLKVRCINTRNYSLMSICCSVIPFILLLAPPNIVNSPTPALPPKNWFDFYSDFFSQKNYSSPPKWLLTGHLSTFQSTSAHLIFYSHVTLNGKTVKVKFFIHVTLFELPIWFWRGKKIYASILKVHIIRLVPKSIQYGVITFYKKTPLYSNEILLMFFIKLK